jgi:type I restriction enzyme R subunit
VLWDDNGKPLALKPKRTTKDIEVGKHQAFLYANCLEQMHGQRPVIFYTNGYETKLMG